MSESYNAEKINAVWNRVAAAQEPGTPAQDEGQMLRSFMDGAAADEADYRTMARACRDQTNRRLFSAAAAAKARSLRALQAAYFARIGDSYVPHAVRQPFTGLLSALRARYAKERMRLQAYTQAAQNTRDPQLEKLFRTLAGDAQQRLDAIDGVLMRLMR